tara:strand:+ start:54 stop:1073 length:1020 start_codon:yes stop_codon:yes gene_type:complete
MVVDKDTLNSWCSDAKRIAGKIDRVEADEINHILQKPARKFNCLTVDFALSENYSLKLVEASPFPNNNMIFWDHERMFRDNVVIDGLNQNERRNLLYSLTEFSHAPTYMVDEDPLNQITSHDFYALSKTRNIKVISLNDVKQEREGLFYVDTLRGKEFIRNLYNRVVSEGMREQDLKKLNDLIASCDNVYGDPYWRFALSKNVIAKIEDKTIPPSFDINTFCCREFDITEFVAKPTFGYGGRGIILHPTLADIDTLKGTNYILQERINYAPYLEHYILDDKLRVEVRFMFIRDKKGELRISNIVGKATLDGMMSIGSRSVDGEFMQKTNGMMSVLPSEK